MDFFAIMSPRLGCLITGNFVQTFFQSAFAISLTHSSLHRSNARWAPFSKRNEIRGESLTGVRKTTFVAFTQQRLVQRYLHGPGTGITNLPSFSATKFSELLDELPFASFFSTLITSFFVGLRFRKTLPVGPSIWVVAFLTSSGVRLTSSMVEIFPPAPPDCIILKNSSASGS